MYKRNLVISIAVFIAILLTGICYEFIQAVDEPVELEMSQTNNRIAVRIIEATNKYLSENKDNIFSGFNVSKKTPIATNIYNSEDERVYIIDPIMLQEQILIEPTGEICGPYLDTQIINYDESFSFYIVIIKGNDIVIKVMVTNEQNPTWDQENENLIGTFKEWCEPKE